MSLQRAKSNAFLTMLALRDGKRAARSARLTAEEKKRIAADRERVVLDAIGDRSDPGYVELAAAEAWDAHQDLISAKAEVEGAHHFARKKFEEHHAAFAALVEIQRDEDNLG